MPLKPKKPAPPATAVKKSVKKTVKKLSKKIKVDAPALIAALEAHILGAREMTSTQVTAALALLKKYLACDEDGSATGRTLSHEDALEFLE